MPCPLTLMLQTCNAAASDPFFAPDRYNDEHCTVAERPARRNHAKGFPTAETSSSRIVITVLGKNRPVSSPASPVFWAMRNVDIRDITQSIIEDIFTMTMLADTAESKLDFAELQKALAEPASFRASTCPSSARMSSTLCTACSEQSARAA